uniref:Retrotransposon Copia-like N-terminal domain-containing protein n=1 Tax=Fagus sylvatica TaxID=28930 RepID=A0A2N9GBD2_FAGSY
MANDASAISGSNGSSPLQRDESINQLFLHHGDSPDTILVSQPLSGENYNTWSRSMIMAFTAKNKIGFINGTITTPNDETLPSFNLWTRFSKDIASPTQHCENMWEEHNTRNVGGPEGMICTREWSFPPCSCGALKILTENKQHENVMQFLMGLNNNFAYVRAQILMMEPLPAMNKLFIPDLRCLDITMEVEANLGRRIGQCAVTVVFTGHIVDKCYKLHGFPPSYKSRGNAHAANQVSVLEEPHMPITQAQCQQLLALLSSQASLNAVPPPQTPPPASSQSEASSSTPHQVATASSQFLSGPKVWRPYFLSSNSPITVTDSLMLNGTTAIAVAASLFTPEDGRVLARRTDSQTINDSMALTIQCVASFSNMGRRLHVSNHEIRALRSKLPFCNGCSKTTKRN